jgi:polyisoprenoid-binding protein YceI
MPAAGTYRIDSSRSELRLLVYRAGALANLGHNHVISNRGVNGTIVVAPMFADSSLSLSAPIAAFMVDDAQARREEGGDFPGEISDDAKSGTMNNMTGPALLNAAQYPVISVRSLRLAQSHGDLTATLAVSVAGHDSTLEAPFLLTADRNSLAATASFELRQSALGLTPFSLLLGALAVRDAMQVKLNVVAAAEPQH